MTPVHDLNDFSLGEVFTFLFVMLGPLRAIGPFAQMTAGLDAPSMRRNALLAVPVAAAVLIAAALIGSRVLANWQVSPGSLAVAGGLIMLLVALPAVVSSSASAAPAPAAQAGGEPPKPPAPAAGLLRQIVAMLVSPYGLATLVLFVCLMPERTGGIVLTLLGVMALDVLCLIYSRAILARLRVPLSILGMIFGVLQVALAIQVIVYGVHLIGVAIVGVHSAG